MLVIDPANSRSLVANTKQTPIQPARGTVLPFFEFQAMLALWERNEQMNKIVLEQEEGLSDLQMNPGLEHLRRILRLKLLEKLEVTLI